MFGFLNDTTIRASDEKGFTLALPETTFPLSHYVIY